VFRMLFNEFIQFGLMGRDALHQFLEIGRNPGALVKVAPEAGDFSLPMSHDVSLIKDLQRQFPAAAAGDRGHNG